VLLRLRGGALSRVWNAPACPGSFRECDQFCDHPGLPRGLEFFLGKDDTARVGIVWSPLWTPARMTGSGACVFAEFATEAEARAVHAQLPGGMSGFVARGLGRAAWLGRTVRLNEEIRFQEKGQFAGGTNET